MSDKLEITSIPDFTPIKSGGFQHAMNTAFLELELRQPFDEVIAIHIIDKKGNEIFPYHYTQISNTRISINTPRHVGTIKVGATVRTGTKRITTEFHEMKYL